MRRLLELLRQWLWLMLRIRLQHVLLKRARPAGCPLRRLHAAQRGGVACVEQLVRREVLRRGLQSDRRATPCERSKWSARRANATLSLAYHEVQLGFLARPLLEPPGRALVEIADVVGAVGARSIVGLEVRASAHPLLVEHVQQRALNLGVRVQYAALGVGRGRHLLELRNNRCVRQRDALHERASAAHVEVAKRAARGEVDCTRASARASTR
jgi:hypothetical protein